MKLITTFSVFGIMMMPVVGLAQGYDIEAAMKAAEALQQQQAGKSQQDLVAEMPDVIELKDADITGFITTMTQLKKLGLDLDQKTSKQGPDQAMKALMGNKKAMAILNKNKFSADRLSQVAFSVAMALATQDVSKKDVAQAKSQGAQALESMRGNLSADQFALMKKQMGASLKMVDQMKDQPKGNIELVTKHRKALEAVFE